MDSNSTAILDSFQRQLDDIEKMSPMTDNYARIDPYIVRKEDGGLSFDFIIYHKESELWYGPSVHPEWTLNYFSETGFVRSNDIVWDVGCNSGLYSVWFALTAKQGHVYCFDPFPWNAAATMANARLNSCSNITVFPVGLGSRDRKVAVHRTSAKTKSRNNLLGAESIVIQVKDIRHFIKTAPTFIKIDVEGAEQELARTSMLSVPSLRRGYIEMHPQDIAPRNPRKFLRKLIKLGYEVRRNSPRGELVNYPVENVEPIGYCFELRPEASSVLSTKLRRAIDRLNIPAM